jgi:lysophospholipase L1-like esterase
MFPRLKHFLAAPLAAGALLLLSLSLACAQIKVACVGDSITAGYLLADPGTQSYPAQLQGLLGSGYTVGNYGDTGRTLLQGSGYSYWDSWAYTSSMGSSPNIVVIMLGTNDSKSWNWNATNFDTQYRSLIAGYQGLASHPKVYICLPPPVYSGSGFDPATIQNTLLPAIRAVATEAGVTLIDNNTPLQNHPELFTDGVHPTAQGAAIVAATVKAAFDPVALANASTALYAFEGDAQDTSGNGLHGTATSVSYTTGKIGAQAAQFNGSSSNVSIPKSVTDDFTVAMWVKTTDTAGAAGNNWWAGKALVDGEVAGGAADWGTAIVNGKFVLGVGSTNGDTTIASSVNINDGTWHHVLATRNNTSGAMTVYVDGVSRGTGTGPTASRSAPPGLRIGASQPGGSAFLNGTLDDVRLYNRILSATEIAALASGAKPAAPAGVAAIPGNGSIALNWTAPSTATGYYVKRATTSGGPYTTVGAVTSPYVLDANLTNGTSYYYVVSAVNAYGETANSAEVVQQSGAKTLHVKFDEASGATAADSSGYGFNATLVNGPTFVAGKINNALSFASASSQYATLPTGIVSALGDFTVSAWVKPTTLDSWARVFDFGSGTSTYMYLSTKSGDQLKPRFAIKMSGGSEQQINAGSALSTGVWTHVAVTLSGTTGTLYINGVVSGTNSAMTSTPSALGATTQNYLGKSQFSSDPYLNGALDDFRVYSRALSASEIAQLAAGQLPAPQNVAAMPGSGKITLSWSAVSNATDYTIQRASSSGGSYSTLTNSFAGTSYDDTGLVDGVTWYYTVAANGFSGTGLASAPVSATTYTAVENWRLANFGTVANSGNAADSADPDGDGLTNTQEFTSGTNPNSAASALKVAQVQTSGSNLVVSFPTVSGKTYRLERSDTLQNGSWSTVQDNIAGTGGVLQITDPGAAAQSKRFYRVIAW